MEEDINIIDAKTRNEKIKNFFIENKKLIIIFLSFLIITIISFYSYQIYKEGQRVKISDKYNSVIIDYKKNDKSKTVNLLKEIISYKDNLYSPLALYFLIDKKLVKDKNEVNNLFDILINIKSLEKEIKNLIILKKALFNADEINELKLLKILNPIINSESVWKSHALYLVAEYFYDKGEIQKSKDFFQQIILIDNPNLEIKIKAQKRLNRDLSD